MGQTTPDGVSTKISLPGCHYLPGDAARKSGFKPGEIVQARTDVGHPITLTIHSAHKAGEWWATTERGNWCILRARRPVTAGQMRSMNSGGRTYRRDKLGRFA
jgi:hypothetical protein